MDTLKNTQICKRTSNVIKNSETKQLINNLNERIRSLEELLKFERNKAILEYGEAILRHVSKNEINYVKSLLRIAADEVRYIKFVK